MDWGGQQAWGPWWPLLPSEFPQALLQRDTSERKGAGRRETSVGTNDTRYKAKSSCVGQAPTHGQILEVRNCVFVSDCPQGLGSFQNKDFHPEPQSVLKTKTSPLTQVLRTKHLTSRDKIAKVLFMKSCLHIAHTHLPTDLALFCSAEDRT